ncbi:hypothetical protein ACFV24_09475 [Nocardia fluminea]|uniref:hypothetical protein n=1 Tax=Nocardia fluminea TaxID=134984 RepID=UPI00366FA987
MITFGFVVTIALPLAVIVGVIVWPERIPPERTVEHIRQRVEDERRRNANGANRFRRQYASRPARQLGGNARQIKPRDA